MNNAPRKLNFAENSWDSTFRMMSWWDSDKVQQARIMVVGAGALGNEVLKNLALLNVGQILLVDFDKIEYANLSRSVLFREDDCGRSKARVAAERIRELNPNVKVQHLQGDIGIDVGLGVFRQMDVIIGCLDNRLARLLLNRACHKVGKTWIDGAIENLAGQLQVYRPGAACYECQLGPAEWQSIRYRLGCPDIARRNANNGKIPTTPISASIIGAMQAQEALKVVFGNDEKSLAGNKFYYEGMNNEVLMVPSPPISADCLSHYRYDPIIEMPELSANMSLEATFDLLSQKLGDQDWVIEPEHEIVLEVTGAQSQQTAELVVAKPHLSDDMLSSLQGKEGEEMLISNEIRQLDRSFPHQDLSLQALGIPPWHVLAVRAGMERYFVELTGDQAFLHFS
jgi:molybdopterin/thiamine biosynthesis adenylyltransferase